MRLRFTVLASLVATFAAVAAPTIVSAAPKRHRSLTINATPNPVLAGQGVLIYGQLNDRSPGGRTIILYRHLSGSPPGYTRIGQTTTDSNGFYEFTREEGVVLTNRSWFVREAGRRLRSRTVFEHVNALVSIGASTTNSDTNHPVMFIGRVTPNHGGERVFLEEKKLTSDEWHTLKRASLTSASTYAIAYRWRVPGERDVRVVFPGDSRNLRGESDTVSVTVNQAQVSGFTINSSDPIIADGNSVRIFGVLDQPGTTTPATGISVTLWGRNADQPRFRPIATTSTLGDGSYSFTQTPTVNERYRVRTTFPPARHTAVLFQGVKDVVTLMTGSANPLVGQRVTLTGSVSPDKAGHLIYLQILGADGDWHRLAVTHVSSASLFRFVVRFGTPGSKMLRARIFSDEHNIGGASPAVTETVTLPPVSTLPPGP